MIDIKSLLDSQNIEYRESGSNVTRGWIELNCPLCSDPSTHLGINLESNFCHCWVCGAKMHLEKLLHILLNRPYFEVKQIINEFSIDFEEEEKAKSTNLNSDLLKPYDIVLPKIHRDYLIKRRFDPDFIQGKYSIRAQYKYGFFAFRIVIPILEEGQVVNLTGRDISGKQERYKHLPNEKAIIPMKDCIYNIDTAKDKVIICEGPTDVWRIGDRAVATMGTEFTTSQIKLLKDRNLKSAFILFDKEAETNAEKLANALSGFIGKVEVLYLDKGDPADLSDDEVKILRKEIGID